MTKKNKTKTVKYVAPEKRSKKAQRERNASQRGTWGCLNPITRIVPNKKAYDRNAAKRADRKMACAAF